MLRLSHSKGSRSESDKVEMRPTFDNSDVEVAVVASHSVCNNLECSGGKKRLVSIFETLAKALHAILRVIPQPSDTTHDIVQSRTIVLCSSLLLFIFLVFAVFPQPLNTIPSGSSLVIAISLPRAFKTNFFDPVLRFPSFLMLDNGAKLA